MVMQPHDEDPLVHEFHPDLWEEVLKYRGEYVVVSDTEVIAHGTDPRALLKKAWRAGAKSPALIHVPEGEASFFLL